MKLLTFGDIHADAVALKHLSTVIKKHNLDALACCGDISIFEHGLEQTIKKLAAFNKPLFLIHGNHETEEHMKKLCEPYKNIFFIHKKTKQFKNYLFVGYGGGGFSPVEPEFEDFIDSAKKKLSNKKIILLTHAPPYNTNLDHIHNSHAGCKSFRTFIMQHSSVILAISGHIHETIGAQDHIKKTLLINPGPYGKLVLL